MRAPHSPPDPWRVLRPARWLRRIALLAAASGTVWMWVYVSGVFAGGLAETVVFAAPGVMFGVVIGWLSHAARQRQFTWRRGLASALAGGALLAPPLATVVVAVGAFDPALVVLLLVVGPWLALAAGGALALVRWLFARSADGAERDADRRARRLRIATARHRLRAHLRLIVRRPRRAPRDAAAGLRPSLRSGGDP